MVLDAATIELLDAQGLVVQRAEDLAAVMATAARSFAPAATEPPLEGTEADQPAREIPNRWKTRPPSMAAVVTEARRVLAAAQTKRTDPVTGDVVTCSSPRRTK